MNSPTQTYIGVTPKILVNGSSNLSLIDAVEQEDEPDSKSVNNSSEAILFHNIPVIYIYNDETPKAEIEKRRESVMSLKKYRHSLDDLRKASIVSETSLHGRRGRRESRRASEFKCRRHSRMPQKIEATPEEREKEKRHRFIVSIVMGTFFFIVVASVLVVVITLTNHNPVAHNDTSPKRYNHQNVFAVDGDGFRKENEELMNSLNYNIHAYNRSKLLSTIAPSTDQ